MANLDSDILISEASSIVLQFFVYEKKELVSYLPKNNLIKIETL